MKVCAAYGSETPLREGSGMHEIRLDVFGGIPAGVGEESLITLCGKDISAVPDSFRGLVDVGERDIATKHRKIKSFHDFSGTPDADSIVRMLSDGDQEISKGAFSVRSFADLASISDAAKRLGRKHVLLGMGELGEVTRIRQRCLGNEFTFGYVGAPTAPGQLSADEMERLGDGCEILGIVGHPLSHSRSPAMQGAAMEKAGISGKYLRFDSPSLDGIEEVIRAYDIRGMNVTIPYKQEIIPHLDCISDVAEDVGAVNTISNRSGKLLGENTDVRGIEFALLGADLKGSESLVMGSGGAARAAVYALSRAGSSVSVAGRNKETVSALCRDFGSEPFEGDVSKFGLVVNCTPIGLVEGEYPADISNLRGDQVVFDMVYGRDTPLVSSARSRGCRIADGADMLVGQGAESFRIWFGKEPDISAMKGALRWPG
ncbi:MAG: shikimate dehydrogenase [Candidatus Methanomethylophilaceae archaeon]|nr:shikimate dehydrogenase [Candidatus Methanomethylophilaceae archaeon]